jgi:hypothetical protein
MNITQKKYLKNEIEKLLHSFEKQEINVNSLFLQIKTVFREVEDFYYFENEKVDKPAVKITAFATEIDNRRDVYFVHSKEERLYHRQAFCNIEDMVSVLIALYASSDCTDIYKMSDGEIKKLSSIDIKTLFKENKIPLCHFFSSDEIM